MANYQLRIDDELFAFVQDQSKKENRSINGYLVNLVQSHYDQVSGGNELKKLNNKLQNHINKQNLSLLQQGVLNKNNILIMGSPRTGKTLLLKLIEKIAFENGDMICKQPFDVGFDTPDLFLSYLNKLAESNGNNPYLFLFIDDLTTDKIFCQSNKEYLLHLLNFMQNNTHLRLCISMPLIDLSRLALSELNDGMVMASFIELFQSKFFTTRGETNINPPSSFIEFSLDEIFALYPKGFSK